jgi:hypothetical protein
MNEIFDNVKKNQCSNNIIIMGNNNFYNLLKTNIELHFPTGIHIVNFSDNFLLSLKNINLMFASCKYVHEKQGKEKKKHSFSISEYDRKLNEKINVANA